MKKKEPADKNNPKQGAKSDHDVYQKGIEKSDTNNNEKTQKK
ncbi:MAG TPA: hypothetical protein VF676_02050 [Flavobacterium sp.]|jgi:hypothetical protein